MIGPRLPPSEMLSDHQKSDSASRKDSHALCAFRNDDCSFGDSRFIRFLYSLFNSLSQLSCARPWASRMSAVTPLLRFNSCWSWISIGLGFLSLQKLFFESLFISDELNGDVLLLKACPLFANFIRTSWPLVVVISHVMAVAMLAINMNRAAIHGVAERPFDAGLGLNFRSSFILEDVVVWLFSSRTLFVGEIGAWWRSGYAGCAVPQEVQNASSSFICLPQF